MIGPYLVGRDPQDPVVLYHDLYDLMRVRGYFGGYYHDAVAAVDIALWDLAAQLASVPLWQAAGRPAARNNSGLCLGIANAHTGAAH